MGIMKSIRRLLDPSEPLNDPEYVSLKKALDAYIDSSKIAFPGRRAHDFLEEFAGLNQNYIRHPDGRRELLATVNAGEYGRAIAKSCAKLLRDHRAWQMAMDSGVDVELLNAFWTVPVVLYKDLDAHLQDCGLDSEEVAEASRSFATIVMGDPNRCWQMYNQKQDLDLAQHALLAELAAHPEFQQCGWARKLKQ